MHKRSPGYLRYGGLNFDFAGVKEAFLLLCEVLWSKQANVSTAVAKLL